MARKKAAGTMTKADAVRAALAEGLDTPEEGTAYIKEKFGLDVTKPQFSTYKSIGKKKAKGGAGKTRQAAPARSQALAVPARATNGDVSLAVEAIKTLVDQLGVDQVQRIAEVFRK